MALGDAADSVDVDVHGNAIATLNPKGLFHISCWPATSTSSASRSVTSTKAECCVFARLAVTTPVPCRAVAYGSTLESGPILGVIGQHPIHLLQDRGKPATPPRAAELWIDCGFNNGKEAKKAVTIGDAATYIDGYAPLRGQLAIARGFDNRVGAFIVGEALRELSRSRKGLTARVSAVATVQEEVGLRGATTSTFGLDPDAGIAVDVTWATDNPGGDAKVVGECSLGKGPVIHRGPNINPPLFALLRKSSSKAKIPVQYRSLPGGSGTDANAMQLSRGGVATALLGVPIATCTPQSEMCHLGDIEATIKLLVATIKSLRANTSFISPITRSERCTASKRPAASSGATRPPRTSASTSGNSVATRPSPRRSSSSCCSISDHIHASCCSARCSIQRPHCCIFFW